ncbi:hypothetical protein AWC11_11300 [Mycobacterium interjectum]|nr:hypothetical protein AWC11_11300 [Mycobacterium interjectum]
MAISSPRQRNAVSEGIALGLCMLQRYEFKFDKFRIDLAFEHAWRDWPDRYRSQFPQISTDLRKGTDPVWVMAHADDNKKTYAFFWHWSGGNLTIHRRGEWDSATPEDVDFALKVIDGDVPLEGWVSLAQAFVTDLDS